MRAAPALAGLMLLALGSCGVGGIEGERLARSMGLPMDAVSVCGDPRVLGVELEPLKGRGICGIEEPVRVYAVGGVTLDPAPRLGCEAARSLRVWADEVGVPSAEAAGEKLAQIDVAASYACRRRNNSPNGKLSEHAMGHAIDIGGFTFADGDSVSVLGNYRKGRYAEMLQDMHARACGPFGVVLGPRADRFHQDHFHFDVSNRDRPYCR